MASPSPRTVVPVMDSHTRGRGERGSEADRIEEDGNGGIWGVGYSVLLCYMLCSVM